MFLADINATNLATVARSKLQLFKLKKAQPTAICMPPDPPCSTLDSPSVWPEDVYMRPPSGPSGPHLPRRTLDAPPRGPGCGSRSSTASSAGRWRSWCMTPRTAKRRRFGEGSGETSFDVSQARKRGHDSGHSYNDVLAIKPFETHARRVLKKMSRTAILPHAH